MTEDSEDEKASEASEDGDEEDEDGNDDVSESLEVWNENTSLLSWSVGQELGFAGGGKHNVGGTTCVFSCGCNFGHVTLIEEDKEDWPNIAAGVGVEIRGLGEKPSPDLQVLESRARGISIEIKMKDTKNTWVRQNTCQT